MDPSVILIAIVAVPILLLAFLKVNAVLVFLSLCLGNVLVQFASKDPGAILDMFQAVPAPAVQVDSPTLMLILLLTPPVLTTIFLIHSVRGALASAINLIPIVGVGLLLALLAVPLLPGGLSHEIMASPLWDKGQQANAVIVGASAIAALFVLWLQRPPKHRPKHKKH